MATKKYKVVKPVNGLDPNIKAIFKDYGINARVSFPTESDIEDNGGIIPLLLSLDDVNRRVLTYEPGTAQVELYFDKKYRQFVMVAKEKRRTITREFDFKGWYYGGKTGKKRETDIETQAIARLASGTYFPVNFPVEAQYEVLELKIIDPRNDGLGASGDYKGKAKVRATVPASTVCFLIGWDEHAMFISVLPRTVKSVEAAHDALRPRNVPKGSPRQGEFFFVPANDKVNALLTRRWVQEEGDSDYAEYQTLDEDNWAGDRGNHHVLLTYPYDGEEWTIGFVWDTDGRHETLFLDRWHKIVRNLEIEPPEGVEAGTYD